MPKPEIIPESPTDSADMKNAVSSFLMLIALGFVAGCASERIGAPSGKTWYQEGKSPRDTMRDLAACQNEALAYGRSFSMGDVDGAGRALAYGMINAAAENSRENKIVKTCMLAKGYTMVDENSPLLSTSQPAQQIHSNYADAYYNTAIAKHFKGDLDAAIADYTQAIELKPDYALAYLNRGRAKHDKGDLDGTIADCTRAIDLKPDYADTYTVRGVGEQEKGNLDGAIADHTKAIELKPDYAYAYYNRGNAKQCKGDSDGAIADFTKAIQLKPDLAAAYYNRGTTRHHRGDLVGAIADYTEAIQQQPDLAIAYSNRGAAKHDEGDLDGAIEDFTKAIELKPDYAGAYNNRGLAQQDKGDVERAIADYNKVINLTPGYAGAYYNRGCLRYDSRRFTDALVDFSKAVELDSSNDYARFRLWLIRARLGEAEAATTELQTYLAGRANGKLDDWASKIGHFLAGQLPEPEFLAAAKNGDQKTTTGQLCEAYFYAASKHLFSGQKPIATDYFQKSIATDKSDYLEYASAVAELKYLKNQK